MLKATDKPAPPRKISFQSWLVWGPVLLPLAFYTFGLLRMMAATLAYPWELDQGEGHNVWSAWLMMQGRGPYLSLNQYPFFNINYPPLHFVLMIPLLVVFGPSLVAGRLLADLCLFGLAGVVGAIVWRYSRHHRPATALAVLLILANPYLYIFGVIATVNVSQVMFGLAGLYFLGLALDRVEPDGSVRAAPALNRPALVGGLALLLAAVYTKQQAVDAVAAGFLYLLWRRPRLALGAGVIFGAAGGGMFLLIDWLTNHQFYVNLIEVNLNDFIRRQLVEQWRAYALTHGPVLLAAAAYALRVARREKVNLWLIYLVTTALGSVAVGKFGAAETYFYSSIAAVAIATGLLVAARMDPKTAPAGPQQSSGGAPVPARPASAVRFRLDGGRAWWLIVALLAGQNILFYHTPETPHPWKEYIQGHSGNYVIFGQLPGEADRAAGQRLADLLKSGPPPVLSEEASFAMINGYEVVTNPSNILVYHQARLWKGQELERMVRQSCFSRILLHGHFLPDFIQAEIGRQYRRQETVKLNGGDYVVWERPGGPAAGC